MVYTSAMTCIECGSQSGGERDVYGWCTVCNYGYRPNVPKSEKRKRSVYYKLAHEYVHAAIKYCELQPATAHLCDDCGKPAVEYDHRDYAYPLDVDPVCKACHSRRGVGKNAII